MKYLSRLSLVLLLVVLFILSACGKGASTPSPSDQDLAYTQIWETVALGQTMTAAAASPTPEFTQTPEASVSPETTNTPLVSSTPSTDSTPATAETPAATNTKVRPTSQAVCDNFQYVSDVTYPDGAEVPAGTTILKTWRIKNLGPCEWNQDYAITFGWGGEGTKWNTTSPASFGKAVKVGETIDLSLELDVPAEPGEYGAIFRTHNADDVYFGPTLTIYIVVK